MPTVKITKDYNFNYSQDYSYDNTLITIDAGNAKLVSPYSISNPYLIANESIIASGLNSFTETSTLGSGTLVKYVLNINNQAKYFDGTSWVDSNGTIAQSNLASEINSNVATFPTTRNRVKLGKVFLNTAGTNTPQLGNVNISYNFSGYAIPDDIRGALVNVPNENVKDEQLATYIELADQEIDSYIGQQYTLPITDTTTLAMLRSFSIQLSAYNVYGYISNREGKDISSFATEKYKTTIKKLEKIGEGKLTLYGQTDLTAMKSSTEGYLPTFNQGNAENWNVDTDLLSDIADGSFVG